MSLNIEDFKSAIVQGLARPNKFMIELPEDFGIPMGRGYTNLLCKSCTLPLRQLLTNERIIGMRLEKITYGYSVPDISFTFYETNEFTMRSYFESWIDTQIDLDTHELNFKKGARGGGGYAKTVRIHQLNNNGDKIYSVELIDAFPTTLGQIDFANDNNGLVEITVNMSFTNWTSVRVPQQPIQANERTRPLIRPRSAETSISRLPVPAYRPGSSNLVG